MSSQRSSSPSLWLSILAVAACCTVARGARADLPPGITLGAPVAVAAPDYATVAGSAPAFATNGTDALACWELSGVTCRRFTAAGAALDLGGITTPLGVTGNGSSPPHVAWDGAQYVLMAGNAWQTLDPGTGALGAISVVPPSLPYNPYSWGPWVLAFGGGEILALVDVEGAAEIALFDESGNALGTLYDKDLDWSNVTAAWSNGVFLIAWQGGGAIEAARVGGDGTLLDTTPIHVDAAASTSDAGTKTSASGTPVVGASSAGFLVAWVDGRRGAGDRDVYGSLVGTDGTVSKGGYLLAENADSPAVAWDGARWWAAWRSTAGSGAAVESIASDGTIANASPVAGSSTTQLPAVAATPSTVFVGMQESGAIAAARFTPAGAQLDTPPIPLSIYMIPAAYPTIAATSSGYLVTWSETQPGQSQMQLLAARVGLDGTPQDVPPLVLGSDIQSSIASAGGAYFVVTALRDRALTVQRLPPSGPPQTTYVIEPPASDAGTPLVEAPSIVCSGDRCLVSWATGFDSASAAMIDDQGNLLVPPFVIPSATATPGASSFLLTYGATYPTASGGAVTVRYDGTLGSPLAFASDVPAAAAWGIDRYLVVTQQGDVDRISAAGALLEPQTAFTGGAPGASPALVWDGRAFLATFGSSNALQGKPPAALEIPPSGAVSVAGEFSIFDSPSATSPVLASSAPGDVLAVGLQPDGQTPRLVARRITVALDAGSDGGVDGGNAGSPDGGDASDAADAGDGSTPLDASVLDGATSPPDGAVYGGAPVAEGDSSGCACSAVGGEETSGAGAAALAWLGITLAFARRALRRA